MAVGKQGMGSSVNCDVMIIDFGRPEAGIDSKQTGMDGFIVVAVVVVVGCY